MGCPSARTIIHRGGWIVVGGSWICTTKDNAGTVISISGWIVVDGSRIRTTEGNWHAGTVISVGGWIVVEGGWIRATENYHYPTGWMDGSWRQLDLYNQG